MGPTCLLTSYVENGISFEKADSYSNVMNQLRRGCVGPRSKLGLCKDLNAACSTGWSFFVKLSIAYFHVVMCSLR
jgi:hypothetical protein